LSNYTNTAFVVIVDNIDVFFTVEGDFLIAHDKKNPTKIEGNSSVFRFEIGQYPQILPHFEQNSEQVKGEVRHEQEPTKILFKYSKFTPSSLRCIIWQIQLWQWLHLYFIANTTIILGKTHKSKRQ
jgi:hypothetical protein